MICTKPDSPLRSIQTNQELAEILKWRTNLLTLLSRSKNKHYSTFTISKKNGKKRLICNPDNILRRAQYRILTLLNESLEIPEYIQAFEKGRSIPQLAALHTNKECVVSFDISDYFTSITQRMLESLFLSNLQVGPDAARTLSELCTYRNFVPQGGLTSPKIANFVTASTFGPLIKQYCDERNLICTVYADDITVSYSSRTETIKEDVAQLKAFVYSSLLKFGFKANKAKTKVMWTNQRQYVCGVVVNKKTNLKKPERLKLRAVVHNMKKNGLEAEAAKNDTDALSFYSQIQGRINWLQQLNPQKGQLLAAELKEVLASFKELPPQNLATI